MSEEEMMMELEERGRRMYLCTERGWRQGGKIWPAYFRIEASGLHVVLDVVRAGGGKIRRRSILG